jgi:hypothetical protein
LKASFITIILSSSGGVTCVDLPLYGYNLSDFWGFHWCIAFGKTADMLMAVK